MAMKKLLLLSIGLFCLSIQFASSISVSGIINTNTTWKLSESPIIVTGSVLVDTSTILTIEPGVVIKFDTLKSLQIKGTLIAKGTSSKRILFTSNLSSPHFGDWGNICFFDESKDAILDSDENFIDGSILSFCSIEYGSGNTEAAISINNSTPYLSFCSVQFNNGCAISVHNSINKNGSIHITNCFLSNNKGLNEEYSMKGCGIYIAQGGAKINKNIFENNAATGSYCAGGISISGNTQPIEITGNVIQNNTAMSNSGASGGIMVYFNTSPVLIEGNIINGNLGSAGYGGESSGIKVVSNQKDVVITNNTINYNHGCAINTGQGGFGPKGSALIQNNKIYSNEGDGIYISSEDSKTIISGNILANNRANAILLFSGGATINNNTIYENSFWGIQLVAYGGQDVIINSNNFINNRKGNFYNYDSNIKGGNVSYLKICNNYFFNQRKVNNIEMYLHPNEFIDNNIISINDGYCFKYLGPTNLEFNAKNNYWNTNIVSKIQGKIYDWFVDGSLGMVTYQPFLNVLNIDAPISQPIKTIKSQINNGVMIKWNANLESDLAGYKIHYQPIDEISFEKTIDAGKVSQFFLEGIDVKDTITVTSYDSIADGANDISDGHESWYSYAIEAPKPPTNIFLESAPRKTRLGWTKSVTPNVVGYKIFRGESEDEMHEIASIGSNQASYIDTTIKNYTNYFYKIQSVLDNDITGDFSNALIASAKSVWLVDQKSTSDFGSSSSPLLTINAAIKNAINGDTIMVAPGKYVENINFLGKNIILSSKYLNSLDTSYISSTIIDGGGKNNTVTINSNESLLAKLIGFTVTNGWVGIYIQGASPIISHLIVRNNLSVYNGSAIIASNTSCIIENSIFEKQNIANSILLLSNINEPDRKITLRNCIFRNNTNIQGAIIVSDGCGASRYENLLVYGHNVAAILSRNSLVGLEIVNSTLISDGAPAYLVNNNAEQSRVTIQNSILYSSNYSKQIVVDNSIPATSLFLKNNIIKGGNKSIQSFITTTIEDTSSTMDFNPLFEGVNNFQLSDYSPAIGKGLQDTTLKTDLLGELRQQTGAQRPDLGAYENNNSTPKPFPSVDSLKISGNEFSARLYWKYPNFTDFVKCYQVYKRVGNEMILLDTTSLCNFSDTTVKPGQSYKYMIKMVSIDGRENLLSDTITVNIKDLSPKKVTSFSAENTGYNRIQLKWNKNVEKDIKGYLVYRNNVVLIDGENIDTLIDSINIKDLEYYEYKISAVDNGSNKSELVKILIRSGDSTKPDTVRNLKAFSAPNKITLSWDKNGESDIWKYKIYRKMGDGKLQLLSEAKPSSTTYIDSTITNEIWYTYAVSAVDSGEVGNNWDPAYEGALSNSVISKSNDIFPPSSPKNPQILLSDYNKVKLTWNLNTEPDLRGYRIYRKLVGNDTAQYINSTNKVTSFNDTTSLRYQTYYSYSISAIDTIGNESGKVILQIRTGDIFKPDTVRNLQATVIPDKITLIWEKNTESDLWKYKIYRGISGKTLSLLTEVLKNVNTYTDATVTNEVKYSYVVSAVDSTETGNIWDPANEGPESAIVTAKSPDVYAPSIPKNLTVKLTDYKKIQIGWTANTEGDLKGYNLYRMSTSETIPILIRQTLKSNTYDDADTLLQYQMGYNYYVSSLDTIGNESLKASISIKTGDALAPQKVQNFKVVGKPNLIELSWTRNSEADLWKYKVYRGSSPASMQFLADVQKGVNSYSDNAVETEVLYYYGISSVDSLGLGLWDPANESQMSEIIHSNAIDVVPPSKPSIISYTSSNKKVTMKWTKVTDSDMGIYRIYRSLNNVDYVKIDSVSKAYDTYSDLTVENFKKYYYQVCAVDTNLNEGARSTVIIGEPVNVSPIIQQITDITDHTISTFKVTKLMNQDASKDPDGTLTQFKWYVNDVLVSTIKNPALEFQQGTSRVKAIIADNDGGMDSTGFNVSIDAGYYKYTPIASQNAGISSIGNNYVFMPEFGGKMQILTNTFTKKLFLTIEGEIQSVSSISQDTIMYLASTSKKIYSFDKKGIAKWELALGGDLQASPTIDTYRNLIYIGVSNYNIFAVDRTTGKVKWSYRSTSPITQPGVIIGKDYLLMITADGNSHLFRLDDLIIDDELAPLCSLSLNVNLTTAPAIDKDGYLYVSTTGGKLIKFVFNTSTKSGQVIWQTTSNGIFKTSPVIGYDGTIYLGSSDWTVYAFSGSDGSIKWTKKLDSPISTTATINEYGVLYIGTESGKMYAISDAGEILWYYDAKYPIGNATSYINGNILFSTKNGELFKVYDGQIYMPVQKYNSPGLRSASASNGSMYETKTPQWGTYQGNNRRSGVQAESYVSTGLSSTSKNLVRFANSPNPFTEITEIEFVLDKPSSVGIVILDITGRVIERYDLGLRNPGTHKQSIDGSALDDGVYIYQIIVNEVVSAGKMVKN